MPITMLFAALTGLIAIVFWVGLADSQQAERREARMALELERATFERSWLLERGQEPPRELEARIAELRAELAEVRAARREAEVRARQEAEEVRQGLRKIYAEREQGGAER